MGFSDPLRPGAKFDKSRVLKQIQRSKLKPSKK